jgi:hypothetical protein
MTDVPDPAECQLKAEALLREAAQTENLAERSRLIDHAAHWHFRAAAPARGVPTGTPAYLEDEGPGEDVPQDG